MAESYEDKLNRDNARAGERRKAFQDIAPAYPPSGNLKRRSSCERDLQLYLETYHPGTFRLAWSADQLRVVERVEAAILDRSSSLIALAMPRGSGKTAISIRAALWAVLYRHKRFVCLLGATEGKGRQLLEGVKSELLWNAPLGEDFRQVCYPFRRLEGNARKAIGQQFNGQRTVIGWGANQLIFPTMPDSACDGVNVSGSVISVAGLTGAIRGQQHTLVTGEVIRPDLVIPDDPQTRDSAKSAIQTDDRIAIMQGEVLGMAGPDSSITVIMPCTVIRAGDLSDVMLDREKNPQWQGIRTKAVLAWPERMDLWDRYRELRAECKRRDLPTAEATSFYEGNRAEMDRGGRVAWEARRESGDLSALQTMMHKLFDLGEPAFMAEYQNEPQQDDAGPSLCVPQAEIQSKVNGLARGAVPLSASRLTCFIDVHDTLLYWCVCAWAEDFTGAVIDYGTHPDQKRRVFTLRRASPALATLSPGAGREGAILAGLTALADRLMTREWRREDGLAMRVERGLADAGYVPDVVYDFCRRSPFAANLYPSRGVGVKATGRPMEEWLAKPGERRGHGWVLGRSSARASRVVRFDANLWKSFVHARLAMAVGDRAGLTLYGKSPEHHQLLAEQLSAERPVEVSASGRTVLEWGLRPEATDNHFLDCVVGCAVAASVQGCQLAELGPAKPAQRKRVSWREQQQQAMARRGK